MLWFDTDPRVLHAQVDLGFSKPRTYYILKFKKNGVDILVASNRLGHAKPSITLDVYGHLISSVQNEVGDKMDKLLSI